MAALGRHPVRPLIEALFAEPYRFQPGEALAILERLEPGAAPLGSGIDPELEAVRIEQDASLAFPASDVTGLRQEAGERPVLRTPVIGIAGISGPLPYAFTESLLERISRRDRAMAAFFDTFNHRLAAIFYRIHKAALPMLDGHPEQSVMADALRSFVGIGTGSLQGRVEAVSDRMLLGFAGILADRRCSAAALEKLLAGVFRAKVVVQGFAGRWLPLPPSGQTVLSRDTAPELRQLGRGAVLGQRVWDQHAGFVVRFELDRLDGFEEMLPGGRHFASVVSLCRFRVGTVTDVFFELVLAADAVPPCRIGVRDGRRLGWTSWLSSRPDGAGRTGRVRLLASPAGG